MEQRLFEDNQLTAYLISQKKYPVRYKPVRESGKIKFLLSGDGLEQAIQNFFANDEIPVQDYLSAFTTLKNIVAAMRKSR
jgi:hypothetical protein